METNTTLANADTKRVIHLMDLGAIVNPTDVVEEIPGVNHRYARELLGALVAGGRAEVIEDADGDDTWRLTEAGRKLAKANQSVVNLPQTATTGQSTKEPKMTKTTKTTAAKNTTGTCGCGCGAETNRKSMFRQGHDARMVSQLVAAVVGGANTAKAAAIVPPAFDTKDAKVVVGKDDIQHRIDVAAANVTKAFGEKLGVKAYGALMNGWQNFDKPSKAAAKKAPAAKKPAVKQVEAKVGRWTKTGHLTAEGDFITTNAKGAEVVVTKGKYVLIG
jgi:hypothetical protein